ncbi:hypothetical protein PENTCL1PPCAC_26808, partial [Pristionchus entomophagus]
DNNRVDLISSREDQKEKIASSMQTCSGGTKKNNSLPSSHHTVIRSGWMIFLTFMMMGLVNGSGLSPSNGTCLLRGVCGEVRTGGGSRMVIPCVGRSSPQPLKNETMKQKLAYFCPMYNAEDALCCDDENAASLFDSLEKAIQVIGGCRVCFRNFVDLWCQYTCSPRQSQFLSYVKTLPAREMAIDGVSSSSIAVVNGGSDALLVGELDFQVDKNYIKSIFQSCIKVHMEATPAMKLMCGMPDECIHANLSDRCLMTCLTDLGTPRLRTFQPTRINFLTDENGRMEERHGDEVRVPATGDLQRCEEKTDHCEACACSDCFGACSATSPFLRDFELQWAERRGETGEKVAEKSDLGRENCTVDCEIEVTEGTSFMSVLHRELIVRKSPILGYPWVAVILFTFFFIIVFFIISACFTWDSRKRGEETVKEKVKFAGTYWGARDLLDNVQRGGAEWYAKVVAEHTFWIGAITVLIVAVVCVVGLPMQEFILDPMDVWTQPNSRSRIEKTTFEEYFNGTPRYTQVIVRPIQTYNKPFQNGNKNFGPIFHHFILQQAFELTKELIELRGKGWNPSTGKEVELGLSDVCYKMVDEHCFVISPMSYIQNNQSILECANRACIPHVDVMMKEMDNERRREEEMEKKNTTEEQRKTPFIKSSNKMHKLFHRVFPDGAIAVTPPDKSSDPFDDDDIFDDMKRKKRSVSLHSDHRTRSKRHEWSIEVESDEKNMDRANQGWEMEKGIGVLGHILKCIENPIATSAYLNLDCGSQMRGAPVPGNLIFGGWNSAASEISEAKKIIHYSDAYTITIGLDSMKKELAEIWEKAVIELLKKYSNEYVEVNFITHFSIQDEINAAARSDVRIVAIGYALMAIYIIFGLSQFSIDNRKGFLRHTLWYQVFPGVMVSVTISLSVAFVIAVYGIIGLHATLMCMEVQPFLLCAIGVNNIFYFVKTYQRKMHERKQIEAALLSPVSGLPSTDFPLPISKSGEMSDDESERGRGSLPSIEEMRGIETEKVEDLIRREVLTQTCQRVLPSMFCTAFTECVCFLSLGLSSAPVLKVFSFYASAGVFVNFFFTLTIFVPSFFIAMKLSAAPTGICSPVDCVPKAKREIRRRTRWKFDQIRSSRGWMPHLIEKYYAPIIFTKNGRYLSILVQFLLISGAIVFIPQLPIGLDEKMSVPMDSYVHKFMSTLPDTLASSMPVHFVVHSNSGRPLNVSDERFAKLFCTRADCAKNSLGNLIDEAVKVTKTDLISQPAMNWIDDYRKFRYIFPNGKSCCRVDREKGEYASVEKLNLMESSEKARFTTCVKPGEDPYRSMTVDLRYFTHLLPTMECGMSGGMAHREALSFTPKGEVNAFYLRSFHRTFRNSSDFIDGLRLSRLVSDEFKKILDHNGFTDVQVFPYSFYYLYYDQYLVIAASTSSQLALSAGIAFIGLTLTTVSPTTALIVALNTLSSTLLLIGYMVWRNIELNALTIVNLAMSLGIDLEFFAHLCFAYANSGRVNRIGRATDALVNVGSTVFSGIIFTKFLGLIVLYNAQSQIFKTYYFDFYLGLLPIGTLHGLVFLPVMLTFWGPDTYLRRYMEQNDKASLTNGDGHGSEEGRADSIASPRSLILVASGVSSKGDHLVFLPLTGESPPPSHLPILNTQLIPSIAIAAQIVDRLSVSRVNLLHLW